MKKNIFFLWNHHISIYVLRLGIDECTEGTSGCWPGFCTDLTPTDPASAKFECTCPDGFELFTEDGQNGFGMTVQFGEDALENAGRERTIGKSCVRVSCPDIRQNEITNGKLLVAPGKARFHSGDSVDVLCDNYFGVDGSAEIRKTLTCGNSGEWDGEVPACSRSKDQYTVFSWASTPCRS